jgi:hypothetical protein
VRAFGITFDRGEIAALASLTTDAARDAAARMMTIDKIIEELLRLQALGQR